MPKTKEECFAQLVPNAQLITFKKETKGLATIQCAYAPEFWAICPSQSLVVLP